MYYHIYVIVSAAFTVHWHDLGLDTVNYPLENNPTKKMWPTAYIDYICHTGSLAPHQELTGVLNNLAKKSKRYNNICKLSDEDGLQVKKMSGPCGSLIIKNSPFQQLSQNFLIQVWENLRINITLSVVNIVVDSMACKHNYILLQDENTKTQDDNWIAKLCGRSTGKHFYTSSALNVSIKVEAPLIIQHQYVAEILVLEYQGLESDSLKKSNLTPRNYSMKDKRLNHQVFSAVFKGNSVLVMNIHTRIPYILRVTQVWYYCDNESTALVFDGPSSRSPLIRKTFCRNVTLESTLFIATIFLLNKESSKLELSFESVPNMTDRTHITLGRNKAITRSFAFSKLDYKIVLLSVPRNYIKLKMVNFKYDGNTEAGCYLGGVLISSMDYPIGPLCGTIGVTPLESDLTGGITFGSNTIMLVIYVFDSNISFDVIISADICEGIINPCSRFIFPSSDTYAGDSYLLTWHSKRLVKQNIDIEAIYKKHKPTCFVLSQWFDWFGDRHCTIHPLYSRDKQLRLDMLLIRRSFPDQYDTVCSNQNQFAAFAASRESLGNISPLRITPGEHYKKLTISDTNKIVLMFLHERCSYWDASIRLVVTLVECEPLTLTESMTSEFTPFLSCQRRLLLPSLNRSAQYNVHGIKSSHTLLNVVASLKTTMQCQDEIKVIIHINIIKNSQTHKYSYIWYLKDGISFTISINPDSQYFALVILVNIDAKLIHDTHNFESDAKNIPLSGACSKAASEMFIEFNEIPLQIRTAVNNVEPIVCAYSSCFIVYPAQNASWSDAQQMCKERQAFLPSLNFDLKFKILSNIISQHADDALILKFVFIGLSKSYNQSQYKWSHGATLKYQQWFYPITNRDKVSMIERNWNNHHGNTEMQPWQRTLDEQICTAMVSTGFVHDNHMKWFTMPCQEKMNNITIICEQTLQNQSLQSTNFTDNVIQLSLMKHLKSVTRKDSLLSLHSNTHCMKYWFHYKTTCYKLEIYIQAFENCTKLNITFIKMLLVESPIWNNILYPLNNVFRDIEPELLHSIYLCSKDEIWMSTETPLGLYRCHDGSFILESYKCDGTKDCVDNSDELYCPIVCSSNVHVECHSNCTLPSCTCAILYFQCHSGGCIPLSQFCDNSSDCKDNSDEFMCSINHGSTPPKPKKTGNYICRNGAIIEDNLVNDTVPDCPIYGDDEYISTKNVTYLVVENSVDGYIFRFSCIPGHPRRFPHHEKCLLTRNDDDDSMRSCRNGAHLSECIYHSCPTQYKCLYSYCIPVHAVCDGVMDCPDGEDEQSCEEIICAGMLKCRGSTTCVHIQELNNGDYACRVRGDDERTAAIQPCPAECLCFGHAVYCDLTKINRVPYGLEFARELVLHVSDRNLLIKIASIRYKDIQYLALSNSPIKTLTKIKPILSSLDTLIVLHLKNISLQTIEALTFEGLSKVLNLVLSDNPISEIKPLGFQGLTALPKLDLKKLNIYKIGGCSFYGLDELAFLDLSYNRIRNLTAKTFCGLINIKKLNIIGNQIQHVQFTTFLALVQLESIDSSVDGLCCYVQFAACTPRFADYISTCTNLIGSDSLQFLLWIIGLIIIGENLFLFLMHSQNTLIKHAKSERKMVHNIFIKYQNIGDFLQGIYFLSILLANVIYQGDFITIVSYWTSSINCMLIGFISLWSYEVSLFMMFITAVERFNGIFLTMRNIHLSFYTAKVLIGLGWLVSAGIVGLVVADLLIGQHDFPNSLCMLFLTLKGLNVWVVVALYVFNSILALATAVMYFCILTSVTKSRNSRKKILRVTRKKGKKGHQITLQQHILLQTFCNSISWIFLFVIGLLVIFNADKNNERITMATMATLSFSPIANPFLSVFFTKKFRKLCKSIVNRLWLKIRNSRF